MTQPQAGPQPAAARPRSGIGDLLRPTAPQLRCAAVLLVGLALVGLLVGFVWGEVAPRLAFTVVSRGVVSQNDVESEALAAADGWFALLGAGVGLVSGGLSWLWRPARGPFLVVAVMVASFVGALVAWRFGLWVGRHPTRSEIDTAVQHVGRTLHAPLRLHAKAALFLQPFAAVLAVVLCSGFGRDVEDRDRESVLARVGD